MYIPNHFAEPRVAALHELMRTRPLATLVTLNGGGIEANHIPLHLSAAEGPFGTLRGHVARANPLWRKAGGEAEALAVFHGAEAYVTPSWYPTKAEDGKAVPTWNYAVAHAYGRLRVVADAQWLHRHLDLLTAAQEGTRANAWRVDEAPADYIEKLLGAIVGIEITITRLLGKLKASQNQPPCNRDGVARGLDAESPEMASLVRGDFSAST